MLSTDSELDLFLRSKEERQQIISRYDLGRNEGAHIDDWEDPKLEVYHKRDRYGFFHDKRLPDASQKSERERKQIELEVSRAQKWAEMTKEERKYFGLKARYREKMISRVHKGVPDSVRGHLWSILLDLKTVKKQQEGIYLRMRRLAREGNCSVYLRQIDLDVNRTYRNHDMFRERYNPRQQALFHVLAAYSVYNSELGYCQGMSQVAALLLMYLEEEDAFWALSQLMVNPKYAMHGFFIQGFPKLLRFQAHHEKVLKKFLPKLKKHLDRNDITTNIYTLKWFFQCFLDRVPFSVALRVWDLYLLEGERVLTAMAYNILRMHRRYLMRLGMDELIEHLQTNLEKDFGYEDDHVIEKLRECMHELRSSRLDWPGRPPPEELPQKPFGLILLSTEIHPVKPEELGIRTALTSKERELSHYAISKHEELKEDNGLSSTELSNNIVAGDQSFDEDSASFPLTTMATSPINPPTTDADTSFDASDVVDASGASVVANVSFDPAGTSSPRHQQKSQSTQNNTTSSSRTPPSSSEVHDRLEDSVRMMLATADLNGGSDGLGAMNTSGNSILSYSSGRRGLDSSYESGSLRSELVRIHVPYNKEDAAERRKEGMSSGSKARVDSNGDSPRYEGNKVLIQVSHNTASSQQTNTSSSSPIKKSSPLKKRANNRKTNERKSSRVNGGHRTRSQDLSSPALILDSGTTLTTRRAKSAMAGESLEKHSEYTTTSAQSQHRRLGEDVRRRGKPDGSLPTKQQHKSYSKTTGVYLASGTEAGSGYMESCDKINSFDIQERVAYNNQRGGSMDMSLMSSSERYSSDK